MIYKIVICDCVYELNTAYIRGARAMRDYVSTQFNPYQHGTYSHSQWDEGHVNEDAGEHFRFGRDVLTSLPPEGDTWEIDPDVPRDADYNVDTAWYDEQIGKKRVAQLISVQIEVPAKSRKHHGVGSYRWIDGYKVVTPEGRELQPYMRKREAKTHCKERGWEMIFS